MCSLKCPDLPCLFLTYLADCLVPAAAEIRIPEMAQVEMNNKNVVPAVTCCGCLSDRNQAWGHWGARVSKLELSLTVHEKMRVSKQLFSVFTLRLKQISSGVDGGWNCKRLQKIGHMHSHTHTLLVLLGSASGAGPPG